MDNDRKKKMLEEAAEGDFDDQLSLPLPFAGAPVPFRTIIKRDGSRKPFEPGRIAEAIFHAAGLALPEGAEEPAINYSTAESLARAVTIYLKKRLGGQPPSVDQVHDAVERVLVQMAHGRTALTYARRRDQHARLRRLREGGMHALLDEFAEAGSARETGLSGGASYILQTSADTIENWNRDRIAGALNTETGLPCAVAEAIAREVEEEIEKAGISTLTTSLIREMTDVRLIERGLHAYREKHRRLGLPLYDTDRIIRGAAPENAGADPAATDLILAQAVKKEFAFTRVFSPAVTDAHLRHEIHLHYPDRIDRLHGAAHSLGGVIRYGINLPGAPCFASPPRYPETLLAQMMKSTVLLENCFTEPVAWEAVNVFFSPFLHGADERSVRQYAQMLVYEFAARMFTETAVMHGPGSRAASEIGIRWTAPACLRDAPAAGPGGSEEDRNYGDYLHTTQQFGVALLDILLEGGVNGATFPAPRAVVDIGPAFFSTPGHEGFLARAAAVAVRRRNLQFRFERGEAAGAANPREAARPVMHQVSINLAGAACRAEDETAFFNAVNRAVHTAVQAHIEKAAFIEDLMTGHPEAPLRLLAMRDGGTCHVDRSRMAFHISADGLRDAVFLLHGRDPARHESADRFAQRLLKYLAAACREHSRRTGMRILLTQNNDSAVSRRFALHDTALYPDAAERIFTCPEMDPVWSSGVRLREDEEKSPIERVRGEGRYHAMIGGGALTETALPPGEPSPETVADFIRKVWFQTGCARLLIV
jgi:ribonucleoside-triphosphate reductase (formate)